MADSAVPKSIWDSDENAALYAAYTAEFPMYSETSRDLVRLAELAPDAAVVDVACGTGVTTQQILARLRADGRVTGVDRSAAMLAIAARSVTDPRVSWLRSRAEAFDQELSGPVDAVICNSAIWQTEFAATANAARAVLATGGVFVFNIGDEFLRLGCDPPGAAGRFPLIPVMRQIAAEDFGWAPAAQATRRRRLLSQDEISQVLRAAGFAIRHCGWLGYEQSGASQRVWLRVPAFTDRQLPGLSYEQRMDVLDKAYRRAGPPEAAESRWLAVVAIAT